jgi:polysaccharide export outer membrane protein
MRGLRLFFAGLTAFALAGCMHRQQAYVVDPATGRAVPVVQSYAQPRYAAPAYAPAPTTYGQGQPTYPPPQQAAARPLYSASPAAAQQAYAPPPASYPPPAYAQGQAYPPHAAAAPREEERGLFAVLRKKIRRQPVYAAAPAPAPQAAGGPYVAAPGYSYAAVAPMADTGYTLDSGDKLRIVVFGQDGITNSYLVGADGYVNLPLIGNVPARGSNTVQLAKMITERLKQGYVREPHVSVEVEAYRPFFILGEVTTPGQYPYVANMTAETAVAIAGGFSPRADKRKVQLSRNMPGQQVRGDVPLNYPLRPGDTIVVKERWF